MSKTLEITQKLFNKKPCKHSVQFEASETEPVKSKPYSSQYVSRECLKKHGIADLDAVEEIECVLRVKTTSNGKKK